MLEDYVKELRYCTFCPKLCHFTCPVAQVEGRESVTSPAKMTLANLLREGLLDMSVERADLLYRCLGCLFCRNYCEHQTEVSRVLAAARQEAASRGMAPEAMERLRRDMEEFGNPFGKDIHAKLTATVPPEYIMPEAQVIYFPGCRTIEYSPNLILTFLSVIGKLDIDYVAVYSERDLCCATPLYFAGYLDKFLEAAKSLYNTLSRYELVICQCPTCVYALKGIYRDFGMPPRFEVKHVLEFLAPKLKDRDLNPVNIGEAAYHDPCFLGRYLGEYELPREILGACLDRPLNKFIWDRQDSYCCGGGGNVSLNFPEVAENIASQRILEAKSVKADVIATACPGCIEHLGRAAGEMKIMDVLEIIDRSL